METKYSPFNITSILRHGSYTSNRGHFHSVEIHEPVRFSPAPMSLAERLAGLAPFFFFVSTEFLKCQCYCLHANFKLHFLRRQGQFFIDLCHVKREKRTDATSMMVCCHFDAGKENAQRHFLPSRMSIDRELVML